MALQFGTKFWPKFKDGATRLSERYFNPIWELLDTRLHALETLSISWIAATNDLIQFGLRRIDDVLAPAFERVGRIAELGFLRATSTTTETLVVDEISTFVITDADQRELFHVSEFVTLTRPTSTTDFALAQLVSYVRQTGVLDVRVKQIVGSAGPHSDWEIITGTGVTFYIKSMADQVAADRALAVAAKNTAIQAAADTAAAAVIIEGGPVSSVNGQTGAVTLGPADVGAMSTAAGTVLSNSINTSVTTALAAQSAAATSALAAKEKLWAAPAAYNAGIALDHQHISVTSSFTLNLITTTAAVGDRFRLTMRGSGFTALLNGSGVRFRNGAGTFVTEAFTVDLFDVTHEFVKVASTDWELI